MHENPPVKSLSKALHILMCFSEERPILGVSEIGRELGLPKSTVHNVLSTFAAHGFVEQDGASGRYRLGLKLFELGSIIRRGLEIRALALPFMEELVAVTGETVHLTTYADEQVVYIESANPKGALVTLPVTGRRAPLYCTGVGKAILAFLPRREADAVLAAGNLKPFTPNTITDPAALRQEMERIRARGYAVDNMEHEYGIKCVAAPIRNEGGRPFAAMSISGPSLRLTAEHVQRYAPMLLRATAEISAKLGWHGAAGG